MVRRHYRLPPSTRAVRATATVVLLVLLLGSTALSMSLTRLFGSRARPGRKRVGGGTTWWRALTGNEKRPGSWPPSCRSKCGKCSPCKAVHVAVQPGMRLPEEYYPEAWRCKCGNKLYMP